MFGSYFFFTFCLICSVSCVNLYSKYFSEKNNIEIVKNMSKMATENKDDLFEIEFFDGNIEKELPISLFEEIEAELCDRLLHRDSRKEDETDGAIEFIKYIVDTVRSEFDGLIKDGNQKKFLNSLTKSFTVLLSVKADSAEKIIKIVKLSVSTFLKI